MRLTLAYTRALMLGLMRTPGYWVPILFFPVILYSFFGASNSDSPEFARIFLGSWSVFAVLGIALFQFGVSISQARMSPWEGFLRTLPTGPAPRFAAQVIVALLFAAVAGSLVWIAALAMTEIAMPLSHWILLAVSMLAGAVPFALIGISLAFWVSPRAAVPIANLLHLALAFTGGLFLPPGSLPDWVSALSDVTPTRHYAELAWGAALDGALPIDSVAWLVGYAVLFAWLARRGWERDQFQRYG